MGYCVTYCFIVIWSIYRDVFVQILHRVPFLLHRFHPHSFIYYFIINLNLVDFQNQGKKFILVTGRLSLLRCTSITPEPNLPCGETFRCQRSNHCVPYVASSFSFTTPNFSSLLLPACPICDPYVHRMWREIWHWNPLCLPSIARSSAHANTSWCRPRTATCKSSYLHKTKA